MEQQERRAAPRTYLRIPLRFRPISDPPSPERRAETSNLSARGICFSTDSFLPVGSQVQLLFKMPKEVTGELATEWRCTGRVVHFQPNRFGRGQNAVGVQFELYEALAAEPWAS
jgi:hypothetical protein